MLKLTKSTQEYIICRDCAYLLLAFSLNNQNNHRWSKSKPYIEKEKLGHKISKKYFKMDNIKTYTKINNFSPKIIEFSPEIIISPKIINRHQVNKFLPPNFKKFHPK